jgi:hypothetical protein
VANAFINNLIPPSWERFAAMCPEPTTAIAKIIVPANSMPIARFFVTTTPLMIKIYI